MEQYGYTPLATIGKGIYAEAVLLASANQQLYAIKILRKDYLVENDEVEGATIEKKVLLKARERNHPFVVRFEEAFQTEQRLCFVLEFCPGGDLMRHVQAKVFDVKRARFYAAEVCLAVKFLHEHGFLWRGLKLDNVLLAADGHIKVIDFVTSAEDVSDQYETTTSFLGSYEFMPPEMLLDKRYGRAVDWWSFGVLLYQMVAAQSPFQGEDEEHIYEAIVACEPLYPKEMPDDAVSLIGKLLIANPQERLGYHKGAKEIMDHEFFDSVDWDALYKKEVTPPFRPMIKDRNDLSNFDEDVTSIAPGLVPVQSVLSPAMQKKFSDFSPSST